MMMIRRGRSIQTTVPKRQRDAEKNMTTRAWGENEEEDNDDDDDEDDDDNKGTLNHTRVPKSLLSVAGVVLSFLGEFF